MDMNHCWAVEFDLADRTVNIELVERILRENRKRICLGEMPERIVLGIYPSNEEALEARHKIVELLGAEIVTTLP